MEQVIMVKGVLNNQRYIVLEEPLENMSGEVEIIIRSIKPSKSLEKKEYVNPLKEIEELLKKNPIHSFEGIDAIAWQKKIRNEWER